MAAKSSMILGNSYLILNDGPSRNFTIEESCNFFKDLNTKEKELYLLSLCYLPLYGEIFELLKSSVSNEKGLSDQGRKLLLNECKIDDKPQRRLIRKLAVELRLSSGARFWLDKVHRHVNSLDNNLRKFVNWKKKFNRLYLNMLNVRNAFIRENHGLIRNIVRPYVFRMPLSTFADLFQEGVLGFMMGMSKFNYALGYTHSTYVGWWVRHALNRATAEKDNMVRLPVHLVETRIAVNKAARNLTQKNNKAPTDDELAEHLGRSVKSIKSSLVNRYYRSLDEPIGDGEEKTWLSLLEDEKTPSPLEVYYSSQMKKMVREALKTLDRKERDVIAQRFGIGTKIYTDESFTLNEIGVKHGLSRERIRQVEAQSLRKLRTRLEPSDFGYA